MQGVEKAILSKVPEVTLTFWIIKVAATTLGETGGDSVTMTLNWGYLAGTLLFVGLLIALVTAQILAKRFHPTLYWATIEIAPDQKVISTGPYARVRHPMYAGGLLYLLGMPLALGSYWGLLALAATTPFLLWRLFDEERFLAKNLSGYSEYMQRIQWRLVPGVF